MRLYYTYQSQLASVNESREFSVGRGVRQGNVLSSIPFNCVADVALQTKQGEIA